MLFKFHKHIAIFSIIVSVVYFIWLLKEISNGMSIGEIAFFPAVLLYLLIVSCIFSILILNKIIKINESTLIITYLQLIISVLFILVFFYFNVILQPKV